MVWQIRHWEYSNSGHNTCLSYRTQDYHGCLNLPNRLDYTTKHNRPWKHSPIGGNRIIGSWHRDDCGYQYLWTGHNGNRGLRYASSRKWRRNLLHSAGLCLCQLHWYLIYRAHSRLRCIQWHYRIARNLSGRFGRDRSWRYTPTSGG